jgi:tetratricopeptide (TPR) repeat protein
MPIRRPRGPKPALRHVAFLSAIAEQPESSAARDAYQAAFLTLRLFDEWVLSGELSADPSFQSHAATRDAVNALTDDPETRTALSRIIDAIVALQEPDPQPVLPRLFAYGALLEHRGAMPAAADVFATITRYVDSRSEFDLAFDALMRQGYCHRVAGDLESAERAYENAGTIAGRARDRSRVLQARIGVAKVAWAHGNLPAADETLTAIAAEAEALGDVRLRSQVLHDSAVVARSRNDLPRALALVAESLRHTTDSHERERVLADLGNFLGLVGAFTTARTALDLLERVASKQEMRWIAQHNLMDLAAREGSETLFEQYRKRLTESALPLRNEIYFLKDSGRGLAGFGRVAEAEEVLARGLVRARESGMHQLEFEMQSLLDEVPRISRTNAAKATLPPAAPESLTNEIESLLEEVAASF